MDETVEEENGGSAGSGGVVGEAGEFELFDEVDGIEDGLIAYESQGVGKLDLGGFREVAEVEVLLHEGAEECELFGIQYRYWCLLGVHEEG